MSTGGEPADPHLRLFGPWTALLTLEGAMYQAQWMLMLTLSLALPGAADDAKPIVRTLDGSWTTGARAVDLKLPPGDFTIDSATDGRLSATIDVLCKVRGRVCDEQADRLSLEAKPRNGRFLLNVAGVPSKMRNGMALRGRIRIPPGIQVAVDMGVGELEVNSLEGDLDVNLGVGKVSVRMPESAVRFVEMSIGVGDGELVAAGHDVESRGWLGKRVDWTGKGKSNVRVSLGVGEARIALE